MVVPVAPVWNPRTGRYDDAPQAQALVGAVIAAGSSGGGPGPGPCLDPSLLPGALAYWVGRQAYEGTDAVLDELGAHDIAMTDIVLGAPPWPESEQGMLYQPGSIGGGGLASEAKNSSCYVLSLISVPDDDEVYSLYAIRIESQFAIPIFNFAGATGVEGDLHLFWRYAGGASIAGVEVTPEIGPGVHLIYAARAHGATSTGTIGLDGTFLGSVPGMTNPDASLVSATSSVNVPVLPPHFLGFSEMVFGSGAVLTEEDFTAQWALVQAVLGGSTTPPVLDPVPDETVTPTDHAALSHLPWSESGHSDPRTAAQTAANKRTFAIFDRQGRARTLPNIPASMLPAQAPTFVPYLIAAGETLTVPEFSQALYCMPITIDGALVIDGFLIEVN